MNFIVFSDDWGLHPSSSQHLFRQVSREHNVLWVNTVGMRTPSLSIGDLLKSLRKLKSMVFGSFIAARKQDTSSRLIAIQPLMIPFPGNRLAEAFNRRSVLRAVRAHTFKHDLSAPVIVSTVPNACDVVSHLGASAVIYYCVDDFSKWPGLAADVVSRMEGRLVERSDSIIVASPVLEEHLADCRKPIYQLGHGVDLEHFKKAANFSKQSPQRTSRNIAAFFGLLDERFDEALVSRLADRLPSWDFILIGPSVVELSDLRAKRNVSFIGPVDYADLPNQIRDANALILPYVLSTATRTITPLKLNEYLATGIPVICSRIPFVSDADGLIQTPAGIEGWSSALEQALGEHTEQRMQAVLKRLKGATWEDKASTLLECCTETLRLKSQHAGSDDA